MRIIFRVISLVEIVFGVLFLAHTASDIQFGFGLIFLFMGAQDLLASFVTE